MRHVQNFLTAERVAEEERNNSAGIVINRQYPPCWQKTGFIKKRKESLKRQSRVISAQNCEVPFQ